MAAVLKGNTATMSISNVAILKIQLIDDENLFYQFLDIADQKAYDIVQASILYSPNPDVDLSDDDYSPCFYLDADTDQETPYFLSEFIRDTYPEIQGDGSLPKGRLDTLSSDGWNT
jgi:hypothetical protein